MDREEAQKMYRLEAEIERLREALSRIAMTTLDIYPGEKSEIAQETLRGKANPNPKKSPPEIGTAK